jgi:uncharacterized protein with HEPN domain
MLKGEMPVATQLQPNLDRILTDRLGVTLGAVGQVCQRWQIDELALFGSVLRDDFGADSDVDVLVTDDYAANRMMQRAIERSLEILGEAANRLPKSFQAAHGEIDWGRVVGLRNVIIHCYDEVEDEQVWQIITVEVPRRLAQVKPLVPSLLEN